MATVQELFVKISGDASEFTDVLKAASNSVTDIGNLTSNIGKKISSIGTGITAGVTVPIVGAATSCVKNFTSVNETFTLTKSALNATEEEAAMLSQAMQTAASASTYGMQDAATATLNFARAGLTATESAAALAPALNLASGEGGNLDTVSAGLVSTINAFGDSFDKTIHYADVFAVACDASQLDVDELANAMSVAAPIFASAGYSVEDASVALGVMGNKGIEANVAANALKTGLARLVAPTDEGAEALAALGVEITNADGSMRSFTAIQEDLSVGFSKLSESEQIEAASAIFGKNQMASWLALINTAPSEVQSLDEAISNCSGTTEKMAQTMMDENPWLALQSSIDVLAYSFGSIITDYLIPFIEKIQTIVDKFNALDDKQKDQIVKWAAIAAAVGPCVIVFGKLVTGVGSVVTAFGKIGGVVSGIAGHFSSVSSGATKAASSFGSLAGEALKLVAAAAVILAAATAIKILADSAISLYNAGPGAIATFAGLTAAAIAITAAIAAIGSACTATSVGLLALGAAVLMVCTGIAEIGVAIALVIEAFSDLVDSITKLSDKIPLIAEYGLEAAANLAVLSAAILALGAACSTAVIPIAALDLALAAFDVTAGLATPVMTSLAVAIGLLDLALVGLAASTSLCGEAFETTFETISSIVSDTVDSVCKFVSNLVDKVVGFFEDLKYKLIGDPIVIDMVDGIIEWFGNLVSGVVDFVKELVDKVVNFFSELKDKVVEIAGNLKDKAIEIFGNLKEKIQETVENLKEKVQEKFDALKDKVVNSVTNLKDKAKEKFEDLKSAITEKMQNTVDSVKEKCTNIVDAFKEIDLIDIGKNIIEGFLDGLKGAWNKISSWVSEACNNIKSAFESAMKIGSPSKVFKEYGKFIDQGLVIGLTDGEVDITRTIGGLAHGVANQFSSNLNTTNGAAISKANNSNTVINMNGDYMFQNKESMDYFMNRLGLVLARG